MNMRALLLPLVLAACSPGTPAREAEAPPLAGARIGGSLAALVDQDGRRFDERRLAGRYRIVYFGYTFCPDVCPVDVQNIAGAMRLLERSRPELAARVVPVFVSVDPERDTPAVLKQFTAAFHPRLIGLTGGADDIARAARDYAVYYKRGEASPDGGYMMDHSRQTYLMAPDGKPLALLPAEQGPEPIVRELERWAR